MGMREVPHPGAGATRWGSAPNARPGHPGEISDDHVRAEPTDWPTRKDRGWVWFRDLGFVSSAQVPDR